MRRNWVVSLALAVALFGLIRGLNGGALWDPHEVTVAELGRRLAVNLWGAEGLRLPDADNSVPIRADLGRGELPFTSVALGFRLWGLSAWAGRLPLVLWGLAGSSALYAALTQLWDRRVALYGALILVTTPLYFVQARTLLGDGVTLACFSIAWSALTVTCLSEVSSVRTRIAFAGVAAVGLYAGFWCRGPLVNVALPALSVGVPALVLRRRDRWGLWAGLATTLLGLIALGVGVAALKLAKATGEYSVFVGSQLVAPASLATFDVPFGKLAHAAFPWSAAAPLVLALLAKIRSDEPCAESAVLHSAALATGLGLAACAWLEPQVGGFPLPSVACFAVLLAVALWRLEDSERSFPLLGLLLAASALVIGVDAHHNPDKALSAFELVGISLPESLQPRVSWLWVGAGGAIAVVGALWLFEGEPASSRFQRSEYARALSGWQRAWNGNLLFGLLLLETMLVGFLLLAAVSEHFVALPQLEGFGSFWRKLVAVLAIAVPLLPLAPLAVMLLRDLVRALPRRAPVLLLAFAVAGMTLSFGFFPALAAQVSPGEAFERYRRLRAAGEPLGVLGAQSGAARFQGAPTALAVDGIESAASWLLDASERRFLVLRSRDLAELNARYRERQGRNLPVLDARSSEVLLASNRLGSGETDESPLKELVLQAPPPIQHPLHAVLNHQLEVLGYSVQSGDGKPQAFISAGAPYRFVLYYRVLAPLSGAWQTFVHLDGLQRRFNADHEPLGGRYPVRLWQAGDIIVDETELELEPNFSPGPYRVYFGLFSGEQRLPLTEGVGVEDRIQGGTLQVR